MSAGPAASDIRLIAIEDLRRVDLRIGTVTRAEPNTAARRPAYVLAIDLGPLGTRLSSAQITEHYQPQDLIGRQVMCVCNLPPRRVAGVKSEVLVLGGYDTDGSVVLAGFDHEVPNGTPVC